MKKLILIVLTLLFLFSCESVPIPDNYSCKKINSFGLSIKHDTFMKLCGPTTNKICTTKNNQEGNTYRITPSFSNEGCGTQELCLTNSETQALLMGSIVEPNFFRCSKIKIF